MLSISAVSFIGLYIDSLQPKLNWDDENNALRENYNTFIAMGYSLLLFTVLCGGGYYLIDHKSITNEQFTIATFVILLLGNLLLYLISRKKISRNIRNQESL
jgi:ABC-2 type transport system permease protein